MSAHSRRAHGVPGATLLKVCITPHSVSKFLDQRFTACIGQRSLSVSIPLVICLGLTAACLTVFIGYVDLTPQIGENFFFSSEDPQMQVEKQIQDIFPQDPQLFLSARGDIHSDEYLEQIRQLSDELDALPEVISVQSISHGPGNLKKAMEGPLWSRMLITEDGDSTLITVFVKHVSPEELIPRVEDIVARHAQPEFELTVSGEPYINELLRRYLFRDLKTFSTAAFLVFGAIFMLVFRSVRILIGTLLACATASMITLMFTQLSGIETGPLTANLSTIVFILTLSHIIFMTFNWRFALENSAMDDQHPAVVAVQHTAQPSAWSMFTTLLGFLSLLLVQATPLRQLGAAGAMGTVIAYVIAYTMFPVFLGRQRAGSQSARIEARERKIEPFFYRKHRLMYGLLMVAIVASALGLARLDTDPSLFAYFREGSDLRKGLEYIDRNGGSSPLFIVAQAPDVSTFDDHAGYQQLFDATLALEGDPQVGNAVSVPLLLAQARKNFFAKFLSTSWLIDILESERFGEVAKYFITEDRTTVLFLLRMREADRTERRVAVIDRLDRIVEEHDLKAVLVGGIYSLQGRMSALVSSSLVTGLLLLIGIFVVMAWGLSRSVRVSASMLASLCIIPAGILGLLGHWQIPVDIISAPAANIAIAMGVDSMIHMLMHVRRHHPEQMLRWKHWKQAAIHLWRPIMYTAIIIGAGFGIFALSQFPPTQRFGLMVVVGAIIAPLSALISLPLLSSVRPARLSSPRQQLTARDVTQRIPATLPAPSTSQQG